MIRKHVVIGAIAWFVVPALWGFLPGTRSARAAGLLIADNGNGGILDFTDHSVHVWIHDGVAVTEVTQVFKNNENRQVEALYTFPVPRDASVSNFSMWIGGKEMIGEVVEKQRAREIYDSYRRVKRDPGLLEQTDYRTFEMHVFPIAPLAEQKVRITYYQQLEIDDDWATYTYPLQSNTRHAVNSRVSGKFSFDLEARSEIPIAELQSPSHAKHLSVVRHDEHFDEAKITTIGADLNRDVVVNFRLARPRTGFDMIASREGGEDGYFCLTLATGEDLPAKAAGMDYVFLLDVSGSMNDDSKLDLARSSVEAFVRTLGPDDRFELLTFNAAPTALFGHLLAGDAANQKRGSEFLTSREAHGGTLLGPAIVAAYQYADKARPLNVVILSDGLTEQEERPTLTQLIEQRPINSRVFCVGVGNDIDRDMLQQLADESGGMCAFVSEQADFTRQAEAFRRKLIRPAMTDLKFDFSGIKVYDMEPPAPAVLYRGSPLRIYGRYQTGGFGRLSFHAKLGDQSIDQTVALEFPIADDGNPQIERMWAWRKLNRLLNGPGGSSDATIDAVVRLGEAYSIASEYTSFIVLENDAEYAKWKIAQRNAFRLTRNREAERSVTTQLLDLRKKLVSEVSPVSEVLPVNPLPQTPLDPASPAAAAPEAKVAITPQIPRGNSSDLNVGAPGAGGGAIDPLSALLVLMLTGLCLLRIELVFPLLSRCATQRPPKVETPGDTDRIPIVDYRQIFLRVFLRCRGFRHLSPCAIRPSVDAAWAPRLSTILRKNVAPAICQPPSISGRYAGTVAGVVGTLRVARLCRVA